MDESSVQVKLFCLHNPPTYKKTQSRSEATIIKSSGRSAVKILSERKLGFFFESAVTKAEVFTENSVLGLTSGKLLSCDTHRSS